ncbi:MAG: CDP-diacylglycerol--serine O-phosphatidyltransferase [Acidobacteria bacterium]|nr:CDP-diacylglycerol--serine O-phosphatidyltransferase [Acidobacteriota bacterium]MCB9398302.1 CDP-diacylglycerol--serine O-phosphatidyltransferase [Acidobacteriota bacterium]
MVPNNPNAQKRTLGLRKKRNVKIIFPSLITSFSMICGLFAIMKASDGSEFIVQACYLVMVASLLDGVDGKVARLTNTASEFGIQYDSMADLVAFGVAPAFIYFRYYLYQKNMDQIYLLLPILFMVCGAVRLARFNITASTYGKSAFQGLPIPAAAVTISVLPALSEWVQTKPYLVSRGYAEWFRFENIFPFTVGLLLILSLTMISNLRFDTFETFWFKKFRSKKINMLIFCGFLSLIFVHFIVYMTAVATYYLCMMYLRALRTRFSKPLFAPAASLEAEAEEVDDSPEA